MVQTKLSVLHFVTVFQMTK